MDGVEAVRRIRAGRADRPSYLILLTARGGKRDIVTALDAGADDYLVKPFDPCELRARIEVGRRMIEMQGALAARITELREALDQIKTLRGILPICMHCKKIRDDGGYWNQGRIVYPRSYRSGVQPLRLPGVHEGACTPSSRRTEAGERGI